MSLEDDAKTIDRAGAAEAQRRLQLADRQVALLDQIASNTSTLSAIAGLWTLIGIGVLLVLLARSCS
jgi:hypothetical protein